MICLYCIDLLFFILIEWLQVFEVADRELGIFVLLDVSDMVVMKVFDKLSVVIYVFQYYNYFYNKFQCEFFYVGGLFYCKKKIYIVNRGSKYLYIVMIFLYV